MSIATQQAILHTNKGDIKLNLFGNHAPKTVANFVELAEGTREYKDDAGRTPPVTTTAWASTASSSSS